MRYLVTARVKPGQDAALAEAIDDGVLGPDPARPGLWTGELRATAGVASFSGIWLGVP